ncbi:hypothetical protein [Treponema sp. OMZ 789]|uniref:hypothetical protein n=1 Tax=Treponema sp. OMZ 789 TaxID=2563670 RepID=UPI0020A53064|nr:hypothetical protein [Treponema sp. OMZ 789]UTC65837.1 hypothetical protein E4O06_10635 [Treponema sp. OMZ 789]
MNGKINRLNSIIKSSQKSLEKSAKLLDKAERAPIITQHSALSTQHSALSTQHSALSTQHSALSTQHSALSTQHSALSTLLNKPHTQHNLLTPVKEPQRPPSVELRSTSQRIIKKYLTTSPSNIFAPLAVKLHNYKEV